MGSGSPNAGHGSTICSPARTFSSTGPAGGKLGGSTTKRESCSSTKQAGNEKFEVLAAVLLKIQVVGCDTEMEGV
jgi:hypothetical protein